MINFLGERTIANYFFLPVIILIVIFFLPCFLSFISRKKFLSNPLIGLNFSLIFLSFLGVLFLNLFVDFRIYWSFIILYVFFLSTYFIIYKKRKYLKNFLSLSKNEVKILFLLLLISTLVLSFSELVNDYFEQKSRPFFQEKFIEAGKDTEENYLVYEGDYILPFNSVGRYLLGKEGFSTKILNIYNVTDRTPLFYFSLIPLFKVFGESFFVYQMISVVFSVLYIVPSYLIGREFLKKSTAALCCLALSFSQFFLFISTFGQTKTITLFFILGAIWIIITLAKKNIPLGVYLSSYLFAGAYFTHQFSLLYYFAGFFFLLSLLIGKFGREKLKIRRDLKKVLATSILYLFPILFTYLMWKNFTNLMGTPNLVYQNIVFSSDWAIAGPNIKMNKIINYSEAINFIFSKDFWLNKGYNLLGLIFFNPKPGIIRLFSPHDITIPGALAGLFSWFFILALFSGFLLYKFRQILYFIFLVPIFSVLYHGFYIRMGLMWYVLGIIPLMTIYIFRFAEKILNSNKLIILFTLMNIAENLYLHWTKTRHQVFERLIEFWKWQSLGGFLFISIVGLSCYLIIKSVYLKDYDE